MDLNLVKYSRAGDVFHYRWAARRCLKMIYPTSSLECIFIEGSKENKKKGEYVIDVAEYDKSKGKGRTIRYFQLKHSTKRVDKTFQLSELKKTIKGFAKRFESIQDDEEIESIEFSIITNRKINERFKKAVEDLINDDSPNQTFVNTLIKYTGFDNTGLKIFCKHLNFIDGEGNYKVQRNELSFEIGQLVAGVIDSAYIDSVITLIQEKVLPDNDGKIVAEEILKRFGVSSKRDLFPAPRMYEKPDILIKRKQKEDLKKFILENSNPKIIHAGGGVGKSVIALQLADSLPLGSLGIVYDCFGSGKYRNKSHSRHRHVDGLVQIINEIASKGLCEPLIPQPNLSDEVNLIRAFLKRIKNASDKLQQINEDAILAIFIDAADNALMAANEFSDPCFVDQIMREDIPEGCRLIALCRTERKFLLNPSSKVEECELLSFNRQETMKHLAQNFPNITQDDAREFHRLTGGNPRVQANSLSFGYDSLESLLADLGPSSTSVEDQISAQLQSSISKIKDRLSDDYQKKIDTICIGLANLPPFIPINILATAAEIEEAEVKSFVADLGHPLWVSDNSVQFRDENTETWFRQKFSASIDQLQSYIENLKPLAKNHPYVAEVLPSLMLKAEKYDALISLALSDDLLPEDNPIDKRNVRVYRLQFAFKAALKKNRIVDAAKLAFRAGEEVASDDRQFNLLKNNIDLIANLQYKQKVQELAYKRKLKGGWDGSENLYSASLLSFFDDFKGEARGFLRSAHKWLELYFEERKKDEDNEKEKLKNSDILEFVSTYFKLFGKRRTVKFLLSWTPEHIIFEITSLFIKRLIDKGDFESINALAPLGKRNPHFLLAVNHELLKVGKILPSEIIEDCLDLIIHQRTRPQKRTPTYRIESIDIAIISFTEMCAANKLSERKILRVLRHYFPQRGTNSLSNNYQSSERRLFLRKIALETRLSDNLEIDWDNYMPKSLIGEDLSHKENREKEKFLEVIGSLLPWYKLRVQIIAGEIEELEADFSKAKEASNNATSNRWRQNDNLPYEITRVQFDVLKFYKSTNLSVVKFFKEKISTDESAYWLKDRLKALRVVFRLEHLSNLRHWFEQSCFEEVKKTSNIETETKAEWYIELSRAVLNTSPKDSAAYFDSAIEVVSKFGYEIVERWEALDAIANRRAEEDNTSGEISYRFIRCAELVGNNVAREKHFNRNGAVRTCVKLCPNTALSALSRWRDRRVGWFESQIQPLSDELVRTESISPSTGRALSAFNFDYGYLNFVTLCLEKETHKQLQQYIFDTAFWDLRLNGSNYKALKKLKKCSRDYELKTAELDRILNLSDKNKLNSNSHLSSSTKPENKEIAWAEVFEGLDLSTDQDLKKAFSRFKSRSKHPYGFAGFFVKNLFERIPDNGASDFLEMIVHFEDVDLFDIKRILENVPDRWKQKVSVLKIWHRIIEAIGFRFAFKLTTRSGRNYFLNNDLIDSADIASLYRGILRGLRKSSNFLDASIFFGFAEIASSFINTQEAADVMDYALLRFEIHLEEDFGDGEWANWLEPPANAAESFSGFIWAALSDPRASKRWEAAHAVRRLAEANRKDEIELLVEWMKKEAVESFGSKDFPFYKLHAKQYLLIALARIVIDQPHILKDQSDIFIELALKTQHILIQKYAAEIALSLNSTYTDLYKPSTIKKIKEVGHSNFPILDLKKSDEEIITPWHNQGLIDESLEFYFAHDFDRYWFDALGRVFGISTKEVQDLAKDVIFNQWDIEVDDKFVKDPRSDLWGSYQSGKETMHSHSSYPETDNYHFYLSYHVMLVVASKLLENMPITKSREWIEDSWSSWIKRHILTRGDGRWLSDRRDPSPIERRSWVNKEIDRDKWVHEISHDDFLQVLLDSKNRGTPLCISGYWNEYSDYKNERIYVSSAFVSKDGSQSLLNALASCRDASDFKLPSFSDERFEFEQYPFELKGWIYNESIPTGIDEFDPHAAEIVYPPYIIGDWYKSTFALSSDSEKRKWYKGDSDQASLNCRIWSQKGEQGRDKPYRSGIKMNSTFKFIKEMCKFLEQELIIKVELNRSLHVAGTRREETNREYKIYVFSGDGSIRDSSTCYQLG